jgi:hypothetical protein
MENEGIQLSWPEAHPGVPLGTIDRPPVKAVRTRKGPMGVRLMKGPSPSPQTCR